MSEIEGQAELLAVDAEYLWHPWSPSRVSPDTLVAVSGKGCEVTDADGRTYLDAKSSGFNATLGYACQPVVDAIATQVAKLMTYDMGEGANIPAIRLAQRIGELAGPALTRTFFCNSGSEAMEAAIRIARFYQAVLGSPERGLVVSLHNGYHGATMAGAATAGAPSPISDEFTPNGFVTVPGPEEGIGALKGFLADYGKRTAAVLVEPVQSRGAYVMPEDYLRGVRELCDEHGILLVLDEVTTGFGRTGLMFGHQHAGVQPDILATSKGLAAGYISLGAVTTTQHVFEVFDSNKKMAGFVHGHTHSGHATACAAGLAVVDYIESEQLLANTRARGEQLLAALEPLRELDCVTDIRGRGLMIAVEMDRSRRAAQVRKLMRDNGVLVRRTGKNVVLAPPLILTAAEADRISRELLSAAEKAALIEY